MKINVLSLKKQIGDRLPFALKTSTSEIALPGDVLWANGDVIIEGEVVNNGQDLKVTGILKVNACLICGRCLNDFCREYEIPFEDHFSEGCHDVEDELAEKSCYEADEIDITRLVRASLLFAEPLKPLCSDNCRGLCPQCGADLNNTVCSCEREYIDPRLEALKKLLKD